MNKKSPGARSLQRLVMTLALCASLAGCDVPEFKRIEMVVPPERAAESSAHLERMVKAGINRYDAWSETKLMFGDPWEVTYQGGTERHRVKWHNAKVSDGATTTNQNDQ